MHVSLHLLSPSISHSKLLYGVTGLSVARVGLLLLWPHVVERDQTTVFTALHGMQ